MTKIRDFVIGLARAGKSVDEIKQTVEAAYPGEGLSTSQIYRLKKLVKEGGNEADMRGRARTRTVTDADFIESLRVEVEADRRVTIRTLADQYEVSTSTIFNVLTNDLGLRKKSARWVPRLLNDDQKQARVKAAQAFLRRYRDEGERFLERTVTMDESMVSYHTPETKKASKQWVKRGEPGPIKARVHASRRKQMILAFFDCRGLIYTNIVPQGKTVNAKYIIDTLKTFLKRLKQKRPDLAENGFNFHWDNAPVHTAKDVVDFLSRPTVEMIEHPPYSPDLAPADFWLFPTVKESLGGRHIAAADFKNTWDGVTRTINADAYAAAFQKWVRRFEKCVSIGGDYVEKC